MKKNNIIRKYKRAIKITSIITLSVVTFTCTALAIFFSLDKSHEEEFSSKHITWTEWVNKEKRAKQLYKLFTVSPEQSKIYVETRNDKYIVDAHASTLKSALAIDHNTGKYSFIIFNNLKDVNHVHLEPGIHNPIKKKEKNLLPLSLLATSIISTITASAIYNKDRTKHDVVSDE